MSARFTLALILTLFGALLCAGQATANDNEWSRFRGPNGSGVSGATNLPVEFGPKRESSGRLRCLRPFIAGAGANAHLHHRPYAD